MSDSDKQSKGRGRSVSRKKKEQVEASSTLIPDSTWDSFMQGAVVFGGNDPQGRVDVDLSAGMREKIEVIKGHDMDKIMDGLIQKNEGDASCVKMLAAIKNALNPKTQMMGQSFIDFYNRNPDVVAHAVRQLEKHEWRVLMDTMPFGEVMRLGVANDLMKERILFGSKPYFLERIQQMQEEDDIRALDQMNDACMVLKDGYLREMFGDTELFGREGLLTVIARKMGKAAFIEKTRAWVDRMNKLPDMSGPMTPQLQMKLAEFHKDQPRVMMFQGQ
jgi:hypothetical protein